MEPIDGRGLRCGDSPTLRRRRWRAPAAAVSLAAALALAPVLAAAEPYRTEMLIVDGSSLGLAYVATKLPNGKLHTALEVTAFSGLVLGAPIVHAAHGNYGRAGISAGLRIGPLGVAGILAATTCGRETEGAATCVAVVLILGGVLAVGGIAADYVFLGGGRDEPAQAQPRILSWGGRF